MINYISMHAGISLDNKYRYELSRIWDESKIPCVFIMLNPSTADDRVDDPTIKACVQFAKQWGYGGLFVLNLFAYRATNPQELNNVPDPIGCKNEDYINRICKYSDKVFCAWGSKLPKKYKTAGIDMLNKLDKMNVSAWALKINKDGNPGHPLYIKRDVRLIEWRKTTWIVN